MHKENITEVPNSVHGRTDVEIEIYGMEGIPEKDLEEHAKLKQGKGGPNAKKRKVDDSDDSDDQSDSNNMQMPYPGMMGGPMGMPGMMGPMGMPGMMNMNMMQNMGMMGGMMPGPNMMGGRWPMPNPGMMGPGGMMMGPGGPMGMRPGMMGPGGPMGMGPMIGNNMPPGQASTSEEKGGNKPEESAREEPETNTEPQPPKPLFPAASQIQQSSGKGDQGSSQSSKPSSGSKLIHPDDDISMEERRAQFPQYKNYYGRSAGEMLQMPPGNYQQPPQGMPPPMHEGMRRGRY